MSTVRIIYKSGAVQDVECENFTVLFSPAKGLTRIEWENARPRPLFLGIDDIAAVYEMDPS